MKDSWAQRVLNHKRLRHQKGLKFIKELMDGQCRIVATADLSNLFPEFVDMKQALCKREPTLTGKTLLDSTKRRVFYNSRLYILLMVWERGRKNRSFLKGYAYSLMVLGLRLLLCVLDFGQTPSADVMETMIKTASLFCHQSEDHAALVVYPALIASQATHAHLKACRQLEDSLLKYALDPRQDISVHFSMSERHASDTRPLYSKMKLCYSTKMSAKNTWLTSTCCQENGGCINDVPMCRPKDLRTKYRSELGPVEAKLSPLERATQRGPEACKTILQCLMGGLNMDVSCKLVVIDLYCREGDWLDGCLELQHLWRTEASPENPMVAYLTMFKKEQKSERCEEAETLIAEVTSKLMSTVWENHHAAGLG